MGMDGVEILMDVEDHFGISIREGEAADVRTVGDLIALIHRRIAAANRERCPSVASFIMLRKSVRDVTGDNLLRIRPRDSVTAKLPPLHRKHLWKRLSNILGASPRGLRRPKSLRRALVTTSICILLVAFIAAFLIDFAILPLTLAVAAALVTSLHYLTMPFRCVPPVEWQTFGDITNKITNARVASKQLHLRTQDEILNELRPLLVDVLGVDAAVIVPTARFLEDLSVD